MDKKPEPDREGKLHILIAAGGSGGHLLPARQLGKLLQQKEECASLFFMGSGLSSSSFFQQKEFPFFEIASGSLRKKNPFAFFLSSVRILQGVVKSLSILRKERVNLVVGFGSFHSFPVLLAAKLLRLPIILFEANCVLGRVNAFFARKAKVLATQFPLQTSHNSPSFLGRVNTFFARKAKVLATQLPLQTSRNSSSFLGRVNTFFARKAKVLATQLPLQTSRNSPSLLVQPLPWIKPEGLLSSQDAKKRFGLDPSLFTFLLFGGSQGARFLNGFFGSAAEEFKRRGMPFQIIHLAGGPEAVQKMQEIYGRLQIQNYVCSFEKEMAAAYVAADLVVCRSGASTLAELIFFERPAILIPYPFAAEDHQQINAEFLAAIGGALVIKQKEIELASFVDCVEGMLKSGSLAQMQERICSFRKREWASSREELASLICKVGKDG